MIAKTLYSKNESLHFTLVGYFLINTYIYVIFKLMKLSKQAKKIKIND
jgi:hypothetical protein